MRYSLHLIVSVWSLALSFPLVAQSEAGARAFRQAQAFYQNDQLDSATYYVRKTITLSEQNRQWNDHAYALGWLGDVYGRKGQYDSAFHYLSRALVIVTSNKVQDTTLATTYHNLGWYYRYINQPEQAIQLYQQALQVREKLVPAQPLAVAISYESLANVYRYNYYDYTTAEKYYLKVLTIYNQEGVNERNRFKIFYNLATTNRLKENFDKALEYGFKAFALAQKLENVDKEHCYQMLGNIFSSQDDSRRAISFFQKAIDLTLSREGKFSLNLPWQYNNLGNAYLKLDSVKTGIQLLNKALNIYEVAGLFGLQEDVAETYELLGNAYTQKKQFSLARRYYRQSLRLCYRFYGEKSQQTSEILKAIAQFHTKQHQYDSALADYQRALIAEVPDFNQLAWNINPSVAMMRNDPLGYRLLYEKAKVLAARFRRSQKIETLDSALESFLAADSLVDICRVLYDREVAKLHFLEETKEFYEQAIQCAYQLYQVTGQPDYISVAFAFIEKSKAIVLWDALTDTQMKYSIGIPDSLLQRERQLKGQMAFVNSLWTEEMGRQLPDYQRMAQLRAEQYEIGKKLDSFAQTLAQRYPQYFNIKYKVDEQLLTEAQAYAIEHNTTLVDYFWGKKYMYAIGIDAANTTFTRLRITDSLVYALSTYQLSVQHRPPQNISRREYRAFTMAANTLYQSLLFPFLPHPTSPKKSFFDSFRQAQSETYAQSLTIIPDGPLSFLPFDGLLTALPEDSLFNYKHLPYLLRTYSVGYVQSLRVLTQRTSLSGQKRPAMRFLAFSYSDTSIPQDTSSRSTLPNLPGAASEIEALQRMAEGDVFKGRQATEYQFKTNVKNYNIIHLAVHGQANSANPNNNRLVFRPESDSIEDGSLYSYELYELQIPADLAVLSTCESGTGKLQPGEGVYSLARGFTYAGCPSVVMSLWKVDDRQTSSIMPAFYRALFAGETKDKALRDAKLSYLQATNAYHAHPYFWAAFVLEGNSSAVVGYRPTFYAFGIIALLSAVYLGLFLRGRWTNIYKKRTEMVRH